MTGAALLAARAALKLGAGKVLVGFAQETSPLSCDPMQPELMLHDVKNWLMSDLPISAWIAGCGLGQTALAITLLDHLLEHRRKVPVVLDADGLNLLAQGRVAFTTSDDAPLILTPHPAEAGRLLACSAQQVQSDRPGAALALCRQYRAWVVLKGAESLVCRPDGHILRNISGNVGLALLLKKPCIKKRLEGRLVSSGSCSVKQRSNTLYFFGFLVILVFLAIGFIHLPQALAGET